MTGRPAPDLAELLARPRQGALELWLDLLDPQAPAALERLDLDGRRHGGMPWRIDGRTTVMLRHHPRAEHPHAHLASRAVEAARAWAIAQGAGSLPLDYDLPWRFAAAIVAQSEAVASRGLAQLTILGDREADWLGEWLSAHIADPAVHARVDADLAVADSHRIPQAPTVVVRGLRLTFEEDQLDLRERVLDALDRE